MEAYFSLISQPRHGHWVEDYGMMSPKGPGWPASSAGHTVDSLCLRAVAVSAGRQGRSGQGALSLLQPSRHPDLVTQSHPLPKALKNAA